MESSSYDKSLYCIITAFSTYNSFQWMDIFKLQFNVFISVQKPCSATLSACVTDGRSRAVASLALIYSRRGMTGEIYGGGNSGCRELNWLSSSRLSNRSTGPARQAATTLASNKTWGRRSSHVHSHPESGTATDSSRNTQPREDAGQRLKH